jgi:hypothetical protein
MLPNRKTAICQLSTTTYLVYSQLPSLSGGHFLKLQPTYVLCCVKRPTYSDHMLDFNCLIWHCIMEFLGWKSGGLNCMFANQK